MNVREYIDFRMLPSGSTEFEIAPIFNIDPKDYPVMEEFISVVSQKVSIKETYAMPTDGKIKFKGRMWYWEDDLANTTTEQWCRMNEEIATGIEVNPRLVAIYFRPVGEVFNNERVDDIAADILDMDIELFMALNRVFFFARDFIIGQFQGLFVKPKESDGKKRKKSQSDKIWEGYGWHLKVKTFAKDDILKIDEVYKLPLKQFFNYMVLDELDRKIQELNKKYDTST